MYAVSSNPGCTVINGDMAVDIPAGGQSVILALDKKLIIDGDDNAKLVEVRWGTNAAIGSRPAPSWVGDVVDGIADILGDTPFDVNYFPIDNKLIVHTDRSSDEVNAEVTELLERVVPQGIEVAQYNHHIEISWREINKYAKCTSTAAMTTVNPDWRNDLTSDGEWWYNLTSLKAYGVFSGNKKITVFNADLCNDYHSVYMMFAGCTSLREVHGDFSNFRSAMGMCNGCVNLSVFTPVMPLLPTHYDGPDWVFDGCILNKQSVLSFLGALPAANRRLGMGIHIDHKYDEEVLAAIARMEANGWTMMIQWNGTQTAQASTFNMGTLIYAKVGERELPDGTTEQFLDWCHYTTDTDGYEQFRSLESAYEYFGLEEPYTEAEEELQIEEIENA